MQSTESKVLVPFLDDELITISAIKVKVTDSVYDVIIKMENKIVLSKAYIKAKLLLYMYDNNE